LYTTGPKPRHLSIYPFPCQLLLIGHPLLTSLSDTLTDSSFIRTAPMEEAPELTSPRISFSHDLATTSPATPSRRSDTSLLSRLPEPEFDFPNSSAADVAPADRLFSGGVLLPMPPLPPAPKASPCKKLPSSSCHVKPPACQQQKRPAMCSWASPFSRSSSVNSAATTRGAPGSSGTGRFGCPSFPLMRSRSAGSAAVARGGFGSVASDGGAGRRQQHKKFGAAAAVCNGGGGSRVYYYGGSKKCGSHGVRVSPVINVPFIGTSVVNVLSYLLCDCRSSKTTKCRGV
jgi:hypothetical protein